MLVDTCSTQARRAHHGVLPSEVTIGPWSAAMTLAASLALLVLIGTPSVSGGQQDVELGDGTSEGWAAEGSAPEEEGLPPGETPPEDAELFTAIELPSGHEITVSRDDQEQGAEQPVDEERTARPDWLVEATEPEPMAPELAERLEALSAEREAMAEGAADEPVLEIAPLDPPDTVRIDVGDANPDRVNVVESAISDVAPPAAPPPALPADEADQAEAIDPDAQSE